MRKSEFLGRRAGCCTSGLVMRCTTLHKIRKATRSVPKCTEFRGPTWMSYILSKVTPKTRRSGSSKDSTFKKSQAPAILVRILVTFPQVRPTPQDLWNESLLIEILVLRRSLRPGMTARRTLHHRRLMCCQGCLTLWASIRKWRCG